METNANLFSNIWYSAMASQSDEIVAGWRGTRNTGWGEPGPVLGLSPPTMGRGTLWGRFLPAPQVYRWQCRLVSPCYTVSSTANLWQLVQTCANLWQLVATCGNLWQLVTTCDNLKLNKRSKPQKGRFHDIHDFFNFPPLNLAKPL